MAIKCFNSHNEHTYPDFYHFAECSHNGITQINTVTLCPAWSVLRLVTICEYTVFTDSQLPRPTRLSIGRRRITGQNVVRLCSWEGIPDMAHTKCELYICLAVETM